MNDHEGLGMGRLVKMSGAGSLHLDTADVPARTGFELRYSCFNGQCFLNLKRPQDTYSFTLRSDESGALHEVMTQIMDFAFGPPR